MVQDLAGDVRGNFFMDITVNQDWKSEKKPGFQKPIDRIVEDAETVLKSSA